MRNVVTYASMLLMVCAVCSADNWTPVLWPVTGSTNPFYKSAMGNDLLINAVFRDRWAGGTNWMETNTVTFQTGPVTVTNRYGLFVQDGFTGAIPLRAESLERVSREVESVIGFYSLPYYTTTNDYAFDDWFLMQYTLSDPQEFPVASKPDLFHKTGIGALLVYQGGVPRLTFSNNLASATNAYGQVVNAAGYWTKRKNRMDKTPIQQWGMTRFDTNTLMASGGSIPGETVTPDGVYLPDRGYSNVWHILTVPEGAYYSDIVWFGGPQIFLEIQGDNYDAVWAKASPDVVGQYTPLYDSQGTVIVSRVTAPQAWSQTNAPVWCQLPMPIGGTLMPGSYDPPTRYPNEFFDAWSNKVSTLIDLEESGRPVFRILYGHSIVTNTVIANGLTNAVISWVTNQYTGGLSFDTSGDPAGSNRFRVWWSSNVVQTADSETPRVVQPLTGEVTQASECWLGMTWGCVTGTPANPTDKVVLQWETPMTTYEGTKIWDLSLLPEQMDELHVALTNLFLVPWTNWTWTNSVVYLTDTNILLPWGTNWNGTTGVSVTVTTLWPHPEDYFSGFWIPVSEFPIYPTPFTEPAYWTGVSTNASGSPACESISIVGTGSVSESFEAMTDWWPIGTGVPWIVNGSISCQPFQIAVQGSSVVSPIAVYGLYTGTFHRVHLYAYSEQATNGGIGARGYYKRFGIFPTNFTSAGTIITDALDPRLWRTDRHSTTFSVSAWESNIVMDAVMVNPYVPNNEIAGDVNGKKYTDSADGCTTNYEWGWEYWYTTNRIDGSTNIIEDVWRPVVTNVLATGKTNFYSISAWTLADDNPTFGIQPLKPPTVPYSPSGWVTNYSETLTNVDGYATTNLVPEWHTNMVVEGAGDSDANGSYSQIGEYEWTRTSPSWRYLWAPPAYAGSTWLLENTSGIEYKSTNGLSGPWFMLSYGTAPAPSNVYVQTWFTNYVSAPPYFDGTNYWMTNSVYLGTNNVLVQSDVEAVPDSSEFVPFSESTAYGSRPGTDEEQWEWDLDDGYSPAGWFNRINDFATLSGPFTNIWVPVSVPDVGTNWPVGAYATESASESMNWSTNWSSSVNVKVLIEWKQQ